MVCPLFPSRHSVLKGNLRVLLQRLSKITRYVFKNVSNFFREYPHLESHVATYSLHSVQLYVGDVADKVGQLHKGVSFQVPRPGWPMNRAAIMSNADALRFVEFISRLETLQLPCTFVFSREHEDIEWEVTKFRKEWHGSGGLVGYLHGNWLAKHSNPKKVVITRESLSELRACIERRYSLAA